jgi:LPS-assembly lipoprotein
MTAPRPRLGRRGLLGWPLLLALGGCGLHPVYASKGSEPGPARQGLGQISVMIIPDRAGQLLRQAMQARLDRGQEAEAKRYDLTVSLRLNAEGQGIQYDNTTTRIRWSAQATWTLVTRDATRATVTSGSARAVGGLNTFDQQYFGQDVETETVQRQMIDDIADQVTLQLATYFEKHPA